MHFFLKFTFWIVLRTLSCCDIVTSAEQGWCLPGWYRLNSTATCIYISGVPQYTLTPDYGDTYWGRARKACNEWGSDLLIVRDSETLKELLVQYTEQQPYLRRSVFLGARETFNVQWKWLSGSELNVASNLWGPGHPNPHYGKCGAVENFERRFRKWCGWWLASRPCYRRRRFICETDAVNNTCEADFTLIENRCYRKSSHPLNWNDAQAECLSNHGYLAVLNTTKKLKGISELLSSETFSFQVGFYSDIHSWNWLDTTPVNSSLWAPDHPKLETGETCAVFNGYNTEIINADCDGYFGYVCHSKEVNVAYKASTFNSSVSTGSSSTFAVDNNLTSCFISKKETQPWLRIELAQETFVYKVKIENPSDLTNDKPLRVTVASREHEAFERESVCKKSEDTANVEYHCIPPVKGRFLRLQATETSINASLILCYVAVLAVDYTSEAHGVLREVWDTDTEKWEIQNLKEWNQFEVPRDYWNVIKMMDAQLNFGKYYAQRLTAFLQVAQTGNHMFYVACDLSCELWIQRVGDMTMYASDGRTSLDPGGNQEMILRLEDVYKTDHHEWERYPDKQQSKPLLLSQCHFYYIEAFMKETVSIDHLSVGIKFSDGQYERPIKAEHLYWMKTGQRTLTFSDVSFEPTLEVGSTITISASYRYCCEGVFCPDCDVKLSLKVFNTSQIINDRLSMNCQDDNFSITLQVDTEPGIFGIQVYYAFAENGVHDVEKVLEIGQFSVTAAILEECSLQGSFCDWESKSHEGAKWENEGVQQGAVLVGAGHALLESKVLPWKENYHRVPTCLHFKYLLPRKDDSYASTSLQVYLVTNGNKNLIWHLRGFHGNTFSVAQIPWETRKNLAVALEGRTTKNTTSSAAMVIQDVMIATHSCALWPVFAKPGYHCTQDQFQCNNLECIKSVLRCDGLTDCLDESDESNCKCLQSQFTCISGECLSVDRLRDGQKDCNNGEDELGYGQDMKYFQCFDGSFISWHQTCRRSDGCIDNTHFPSICGDMECALSTFPCQQQQVEDSTCEIPFQGRCNFEDGLCSLTNPSHEEMQWRIGEGTSRNAPEFDHTLLSSKGHYLYVDTPNFQTRGKAKLQSGWFLLTWPLCLQFWYHVADGVLNVYIETNNSQKLLWSYQGNQRIPWKFGQINLDSNQNFMFVVEGAADVGRFGDIAIDDLTVLHGSCLKTVQHDKTDCSFDEGPCGWTGEEDWKLSQMTSSERGRFLFFKSGNWEESRNLTTVDIQPSQGIQCLRFWYLIGDDTAHLYDDDIHELKVSGLDPDTSNPTTLWATYYRTDRWVYVQLPLNKSQDSFKVLFEGRLWTNDPMSLALDDVSFTSEICETIPNDGMKDTCTMVTQYATCCRFPFLYNNKQYYSCTKDHDEQLWCKYDDEFPEYGGCQDHCLWTTESGDCCFFPFAYENKTYSSCIVTPDRPRPSCPVLLGNNWDYCKDYCLLGGELCKWSLNDTGGLWLIVNRERHNTLIPSGPDKENKDERQKGLNDTQDFELHLPAANQGNITLINALEKELAAMTSCVWIQRNGSIFQVKYVATYGCRIMTAIEILVSETVQITILGNVREVGVLAADGEWHHVCMSWTSLAGIVKTYLDGEKQTSERIDTASDLIIPDGGTLTVGCLSEPSSSATPFARISGLNIWSYVIDEEEILRMSIGCARRDGDVVPWAHILTGFQGSGHVIRDTSCRDRAVDRLVLGLSSSHTFTTVARIRSPWYNTPADGYSRCLRFRYMLNGSGKVTLTVYQRNDLLPKDTPIWEDEITEGLLWQYGQVSVSGIAKHQLSLVGQIEQNSGSIAIGGLYLTNGHCSVEPPRAAKGCNEHLNDKTGLILSPNYPGYYGNNAHCDWRLTAPAGHVIRLEFLYFQLENDSRCLNDYVEVFDGSPSSSTTLGRFCGHIYPAILESSSANMFVVFRSNDKLMMTGFKARYHSREVKGKECKTMQDCPIGCECFVIQRDPLRYSVKGLGELEAVPCNISELTSVILFSGNKISRLRNYYFRFQSSLLYLDVSRNKIFRLEKYALQGLSSVETLRLNDNFLQELDTEVFSGLAQLQHLDLGNNLLREITVGVLDDLTNLQVLSLRNNMITRIQENTFRFNKRLTHLYLHGNQLKKLNQAMFNGLMSLKTLLLKDNPISENEDATEAFDRLPRLLNLTLDSFILCCYAKKAIEELNCESPKNEFSSCDDMMKNPAVRVCLWILGLLALVGNLSVIVWRVIHREDNKVQSFLLTNLAVSDLLMGVYLIIIAIQDTRWQGEYFKHDIGWRTGFLCQLTGALSMLSSEVSVLLLTIITTDRLICIAFNLRVKRLGIKMCYVICLAAWALGLLLSFLPMSGLEYFKDADNESRFYGRSTVCLALQLSAERPPGWEYSVAIFIGLNLLSFLFISFAYCVIFWSAVKSSSSIRSTNVKRESALAKRVAFIILTDFFCWMPVIIVGILSLTGNFRDPEKQAYVWMAVFVLPVNSSVNPILYTIATPQVQKWICLLSSGDSRHGSSQDRRRYRRDQSNSKPSDVHKTQGTPRKENNANNRKPQNVSPQFTSIKSAASQETCLSWSKDTTNDFINIWDTKL